MVNASKNMQEQCKSNQAQANTSKKLKGTDMPAMIQIKTQDAKVHVLISYERSFQMQHNSKPRFATTATTITRNIVEFASKEFQFEITIMHSFAH